MCVEKEPTVAELLKRVEELEQVVKQLQEDMVTADQPELDWDLVQGVV